MSSVWMVQSRADDESFCEGSVEPWYKLAAVQKSVRSKSVMWTVQKCDDNLMTKSCGHMFSNRGACMNVYE